MIKPAYLLSCLLLPLRITVASPSGKTPSPAPTTNLNAPQGPISISPPSQHPILDPYPPSSAKTLAFHGTINVFPGGPDHPIPVTYSFSSETCVPLILSIPYIMNNLSTNLLDEHLDGITFPSPSDTFTVSLPVFISANITEQLYRSKHVLSLSLKLSPLATTLEKLATSGWRSIVVLLEQSAEELDRVSRKRNGAGLGSVMVFEAEVAGVSVLAEWRLWSIVDGLAVMCES
ncbi:uncharacterized protein RSE6_02520 [Rhynchosporium secalis]|uniref:Uncharacterized protein n=1 Tax=Rhynchosporium secalis TaxID=38038 RepID=A0A1E1M0E3_RHYSE|nr:uncharacterized protein RSE6_02520 [Rhynchosporium secalis]